jgi:chorismate mutase
MKLLIVVLITSSCAVVNIKVEKLPQFAKRKKNIVDVGEAKSRTGRKEKYAREQEIIKAKQKEIKVYDLNNKSPKPLMCFAKLITSSNQHAKYKDITEKMTYEAAKLNSDVVHLGQESVQNTGSVGTYYGGMVFSQNVQTRFNLGFACDYSEVELGIVTDSQNGKITYVKKDSIASKAGLVENMTLIAVNSRPVIGNPSVIAEEISMQDKGTIIEIEYLDHSNNKHYKKIKLE